MKRKYLHTLLLPGIFISFLAISSPPDKSSSLTLSNQNTMNNALTLKVKVFGEGTPLVLMPGGLTGWLSWDSYISTFTAMGKKVIQVQLLSVQYGLEDRQLPADYSVKTESRALSATLDSLGYSGPVDFISWSFGGFVTLDYAMDHPGMIHTLTLIEPPAVWVLRDKGELDAETAETMNFLGSLHGNITDDMLAGFLEHVGLAVPGKSPRELPQWQAWLPFKGSLRNSPAVVDRRDDLKRLKVVTAPVLLVKGTGSAPFLHKIIDVLSSNLPHSRVVEMPGGHAPHIVSRDQFLREWDSFEKNP